MSSPESGNQSLLVRFFDAFLNENNIKWILGAGVLIVLGSSAMLAASHWDDYTPLWKWGIMLAYTAAIYGLGRGAYKFMGLRTTGNALMALTVLLLPVLCIALHFVHAGGFGFSVPNMLFLAGTIVFAHRAGDTVFRHFLRKPTPTFLASYVLLSFCGAVAFLVPPGLAPMFAVFLWAIYLVGVVKVNRHVFWLVEDLKFPRIFGFFPILLLSAQFLSVFFLYLASSIDTAWIGFGCALVALPIFMTADSVWAVHKKRAAVFAAVAEPKASVILPIIVGLVAVTAAMTLASVGFISGETTFALVPTAVVAAVVLGATARRTGKQLFVWLMIVCGLVAYNFSHTLFSELATMMVQTGADAVREERLPLAYYGLTYLPLFTALVALGHKFLGSKNRLFGRPIRATGIALAGIWLVMATTHAKAMFPVGLAMAGVFFASSYLYRMPRLLYPAGVAWLLAASGSLHFYNTVVMDGGGSFLLSVSDVGPFFLTMAGAALFLTLPGRVLDKTLGMRVNREVRALQNQSAIAAAVLASLWSPVFIGDFLFGHGGVTVVQMLGAGVLLWQLVGHGLRTGGRALKWMSVLFTYHVGLILWLPAGPAASTVMSVLVAALAVHWGLMYFSERADAHLALRRFEDTLRQTAYAGLSLMLAAISLFPLMFLDDFNPWWVSRAIAVALAFDATRRSGSKAWGYAACASLFLVVAAGTLGALGPSAGVRWLPVSLSGAALGLLPVLLRFESFKRRWNLSPSYDAVTVPLGNVLTSLMWIGSLGTLLFFTWQMRLAGVVSLAGLWILADGKKRKSYVLAIANWHVLAAIVGILSPDVRNAITENWGGLTATSLAAVMALSAVSWRAVTPGLADRASRVKGPFGLVLHRAFLRTLCAFALVLVVLSDLSAACLILSAFAFALLIADELLAACRGDSKTRVWSAEAIGAAAVAFFAIQDVIHFGRGIAMFAVLAVGALLWVASKAVENRGAVDIMSGPFRLTALAMPAVGVFIALYREAAGLSTMWLGVNSLALFLAAAAYFAHGLTHRVKWSLIASQLVVNLSLFLLWGELSWSDPQLFMIPVGASVLFLGHILKEEIPKGFQNPLYYLGALIILVSPTFNIVTGDWLHFFSLMLISVVVMIAAIGLRLKALLYTGASFLAADIVAMVVRGSIDRPNTLWIAGLLLGAAVVALGAFSENNREKLVQRLRALEATLETWK